uniref:Uncharacterized protein n=1 Tax=Takifugu rubripes TaxID=31033 RepID=A0A674NJH9_TAKRU
IANKAMLCPCDIGDRMDYGQEVQVEYMYAEGTANAICPDFYVGEEPWKKPTDIPRSILDSRSQSCLSLLKMMIIFLWSSSVEGKSKMKYQVRLFPVQPHGFAHRKTEDINPAGKPQIEEAKTDMPH